MSIPLAAKPFRALGGFFAMTLDTGVMTFSPPFAWREYLSQTLFVARVSTLPAMLMAIPYAVLTIFTINAVLAELGAGDYSGAGASLAIVDQIGPVSEVLVISGAAATAICADLGARAIREEIDALRVMGVNPIRALVVPRVLAASTVALTLAATVMIASLLVAFVFTVFIQHVSPGAFVDHMTLVTGLSNVFVAMLKATLFGLTGGLVGSYMGINASGGPAGVGRAVNETVVYCVLATFGINAVMTVIGAQFTTS